ncbi:MAG: hypothetical protein CM1200mP2_17300 [Planctomycetaceae bacterium]|nr:MAG: hypothetical protein CM1200mP2_17300 [Planctomycetaceae bacterium]
MFNRQLKGIRHPRVGHPADSRCQAGHAAAILGGYLDNDRDGRVDNPQVVAAMVRQKATLVMFATEREAERLERTLPDRWQDSHQAVALFAERRIPGCRPAAVRRVLRRDFHLITHAGYAAATRRVLECDPEPVGQRDGPGPGRTIPGVPDGTRQKPGTPTMIDRVTTVPDTGIHLLGMTSLLGAQSAEWRFREFARNGD